MKAKENNTKKAWKKPTLKDLSTGKTESGVTATSFKEDSIYYLTIS